MWQATIEKLQQLAAEDFLIREIFNDINSLSRVPLWPQHPIPSGTYEGQPYPISFSPTLLPPDLLRKVKINQKVFERGFTLLHYAVLLNKPDFVERLVKEGADGNIEDDVHSKTPFFYACHINTPEILFWLRALPSNLRTTKKHEQKINGLNESVFNTRSLLQYQTHLNSSKRGINENLPEKKDRVMILGVGNAVEIDLAFLGQQFKELVLVDVDSRALSRTINGLSPDIQRKCRKIVLDLTGIYSNFCIELELMAERLSQNKEKLGAAVVELIQNYNVALCTLTHTVRSHSALWPLINNSPRNILKDYPSDFIISSLVTSQLGSFMDDYMRRFFRRKFINIDLNGLWGSSDYYRHTSRLSRFLWEQHIQLIKGCCLPGGTIYWSDTIVHVAPGEVRHNLIGIDTIKELFNDCTLTSEKRWDWTLGDQVTDKYEVTSLVYRKG